MNTILDILIKKYPQLDCEDANIVAEFDYYLYRFHAQALEKFIKGRLEHRDDLEKIDCEHEIKQEIMDIIAYQFISKL